MADTWQDLERRFHEIGSRPGKVVVDFSERDSERFWWSLSGPVAAGECRITLVGPSPDGSVPQPDYLTDHYAVREIRDLLRRAGRLLVDDDPKNIWAGAERFVAMTIRAFSLEVCRENERTFFPNAGAIFGMMCGRMVLSSTARRHPWTPEQERDAKRILEDNRDIEQKAFNTLLPMNAGNRIALWHHLKGTKPTRRNKN